MQRGYLDLAAREVALKQFIRLHISARPRGASALAVGSFSPARAPLRVSSIGWYPARP